MVCDIIPWHNNITEWSQSEEDLQDWGGHILRGRWPVPMCKWVHDLILLWGPAIRFWKKNFCINHGIWGLFFLNNGKYWRWAKQYSPPPFPNIGGRPWPPSSYTYDLKRGHLWIYLVQKSICLLPVNRRAFRKNIGWRLNLNFHFTILVGSWLNVMHTIRDLSLVLTDRLAW